jgi:hypothetical protein
MSVRKKSSAIRPVKWERSCISGNFRIYYFIFRLYYIYLSLYWCILTISGIITPYIRMLDSDWLIAVICFTNSSLALWICRIFTSCRCICIRFNFSSWYLQNRICRFNPSPRCLLQNLWNVISCTFYVTSFGRIKQIYHVILYTHINILNLIW